jgi:putative flippase GtrA
VETSLQRLHSLYFTTQFGKFLVAGGFAALANFLTRFAFEPFLGFWRSVTAAYLVGFLVAFALNKIFVLPGSGKSLRQELGWFFLFNAIAFPVVIGASMLLNTYIFGQWFPPELSKAAAHGIAIILPVFVNFAAHKFITFRNN